MIALLSNTIRFKIGEECHFLKEHLFTFQWNNRDLRGLCGLADLTRPHGGDAQHKLDELLSFSYYIAFSANGECVSKSVVCDGNYDCKDGSDERSCRKLLPKLT